MTQSPLIAVMADSHEQWNQAKILAHRLGLPLLSDVEDAAIFCLVVTAERLELRASDPQEGGAIYVDFVGGKNGFRRAHSRGLRQPLARAVGLRGNRPLSILDATPGMGQDAFVLASLGGRVQMVERSPVVAALLEDGLRRLACMADKTTPLSLVQADARAWMATLKSDERPDVIYLDPMYPHRPGTALVKKEMRRLRQVVGDDSDAPDLLENSLSCARQRVVVKRSLLTTPLAGRSPTMTITSKNIRFDVYRVAPLATNPPSL